MLQALSYLPIDDFFGDLESFFLRSEQLGNSAACVIEQYYEGLENRIGVVGVLDRGFEFSGGYDLQVLAMLIAVRIRRRVFSFDRGLFPFFRRELQKTPAGEKPLKNLQLGHSSLPFTSP